MRSLLLHIHTDGCPRQGQSGKAPSITSHYFGSSDRKKRATGSLAVSVYGYPGPPFSATAYIPLLRGVRATRSDRLFVLEIFRKSNAYRGEAMISFQLGRKTGSRIARAFFCALCSIVAVTSTSQAATSAENGQAARARAIVGQLADLSDVADTQDPAVRALREQIKAYEVAGGAQAEHGPPSGILEGLEGGEWHGEVDVIAVDDIDAQGKIRGGGIQVQLHVGNEVLQVYFLEFAPEGLQSGVSLSVRGYRSGHRVAATGARITAKRH